MKIKQKPEDFVVTELDRYELSKTGPYALYRLVKWDIGTIEAVRSIGKNWNLSRAQISVGGPKDRHARTEQTNSLPRPPQPEFYPSTLPREVLRPAPHPHLPRRL